MRIFEIQISSDVRDGGMCIVTLEIGCTLEEAQDLRRVMQEGRQVSPAVFWNDDGEPEPEFPFEEPDPRRRVPDPQTVSRVKMWRDLNRSVPFPELPKIPLPRLPGIPEISRVGFVSPTDGPSKKLEPKKVPMRELFLDDDEEPKKK